MTQTSAANPLAHEHLAALAQARERTRKVRRAAGVAAFSGWTMVCFAAITLLGAIFGSIPSLIMGLALGAVAYNELRGAGMLRRLEARGARVLGFNQLALAGVIVAYSAWSLVAQLRADPLEAMGGSSGDAEIDALVGDLTTTVSVGLYGGMAAIGFIVPGLTAWYYFTRGKLVRNVVSQTPEWVVAALRAAA